MSRLPWCDTVYARLTTERLQVFGDFTFDLCSIMCLLALGSIDIGVKRNRSVSTNHA